MITRPAGQHPGSCVTVTETVLTTDGCPIWEHMPAQWRTLCDWLARHGIDSRDVVLKTTIIRDLENRQVTYTGFRKVGGRFVRLPVAGAEPPSVAQLEQGADLSDYVEQELQKVTVAVQLEAPPLPWPAALRVDHSDEWLP